MSTIKDEEALYQNLKNLSSHIGVETIGKCKIKCTCPANQFLLNRYKTVKILHILNRKKN